MIERIVMDLVLGLFGLVIMGVSAFALLSGDSELSLVLFFASVFIMTLAWQVISYDLTID